MDDDDEVIDDDEWIVEFHPADQFNALTIDARDAWIHEVDTADWTTVVGDQGPSSSSTPTTS